MGQAKLRPNRVAEGIAKKQKALQEREALLEAAKREAERRFAAMSPKEKAELLEVQVMMASLLGDWSHV